MILKEYQELTFLEIAQALDVPVSTVKTRLYRGLDQLRLRLEHRGCAERAGAARRAMSSGEPGRRTTMQCEKIGDEALQGDKLDVVYGEADVAARERVHAHLARARRAATRSRRCAGCAASSRPGGCPWRGRGVMPRGFVVPRWLAAAALFLLGFGATLGASGYVSLRRALAAAAGARGRARARSSASRSARSRPRSAHAGRGSAALLAQLDARIDERLRVEPGREQQASSASSPPGRSGPTCGAGPTWRRSRRA